MKLADWTNIAVVVSRFSIIPISFVFTIYFHNACQLPFAEIDAAKQKVRAAAARKKEEERKAKEKEGTSSSVPKAISKGSTKRKADGEDDRLPKKVAVTLGDAHPKKSPPKPGPGMGKGMMTSTSPVIRRPCCLLTHKDYVVEEVKTLIKPTDVDPCAKLGTKELGESALFDLTLVSLLPWLILSIFFFLLTTIPFFRPWCVLRHFKTDMLPRKGSTPWLGSTILTYWTNRSSIRRPSIL